MKPLFFHVGPCKNLTFKTETIKWQILALLASLAARDDLNTFLMRREGKQD